MKPFVRLSSRVGTLFGLLFALNPIAATAQAQQHMPTASEMIMLPDYCQAKWGANKALHDQWRLKMGPDKWLHVHHFCHGLNYMRRSSVAVDSQKRRQHLQTAINEFDYVLRNWPSDFELTEQARQKKALAQSMLGGR